MRRTIQSTLLAVVLLAGFRAGLVLADEQTRTQTRVPAKRGNAPAQSPADPGQTTTAEEAVAEEAEPVAHFLGEIRMFGGTFAPPGWALCDGRLLEIPSNQALYSLLGTRYGGDGRTHFGLPDLREKLPVTFIISLTGRYPPRS